MIRTAIEKCSDGNVVKADMRGGSTSSQKCDDEFTNTVKRHIMKFPVLESHYCKEGSKRQFLSSDLNVKKMFELFKKEHKDTPVKEHFYRSIFNQNFNLRFHQPKKDQCEICL